MPRVDLLAIGGRLKGTRYAVAENTSVTVGRSLKADLQLADQGVSRLHCRLVNGPDGLTVTDLGSSNGVRVNGKAIEECKIYHNDTLTMGMLSLRILVEGQSEVIETDQTGVHLVHDNRATGTAIRKKYDRETATLVRDPNDSPMLARARSRLAAICSMVNTIYSQHRLKEILDAAVATMIQVTGADRSAIVMFDDETGEIVPVATHSINPADQDSFHVSCTIVQETLRQGVSIISSDASEDDRFNIGESVVMQNIHSVMCAPLMADEKIIGAIYVDSSSIAGRFTEAELSLLAAVGQQAGMALERARLVSDLENLFIGSMQTLIATIEAKDAYTRGHSERVTQFGLLLADEMRVDDDTRRILELAGLLHDVGKIGVPETVLLKPGRLTDEEFEIIKNHPADGAKIIENMPEIDRIVNMKAIFQAVRYHHERFDGKGYPDGLAGTAIPLTSRILAVADTCDAIISDRPYRKGRTTQSALEIIRDCAGTQFDPRVVEAFTSLYEKGYIDDPHLAPGNYQFRPMRRGGMRDMINPAASTVALDAAASQQQKEQATTGGPEQ